MPFYEYQCTECGHRLEKLQKMSDAPLVDCPSCHGATLKKLVSAAAFRLKGTGWYETDFKNGEKKDDQKKDGKGEKPDSATKSGAESTSGSGSDGGKKKDKESTGGAKSNESKGTPSTTAKQSSASVGKNSKSGGTSQHTGN